MKVGNQNGPESLRAFREKKYGLFNLVVGDGGHQINWQSVIDYTLGPM
jgi:hypothetical protein